MGNKDSFQSLVDLTNLSQNRVETKIQKSCSLLKGVESYSTGSNSKAFCWQKMAILTCVWRRWLFGDTIILINNQPTMTIWMAAWRRKKWWSTTLQAVKKHPTHYIGEKGDPKRHELRHTLWVTRFWNSKQIFREVSRNSCHNMLETHLQRHPAPCFFQGNTLASWPFWPAHPAERPSATARPGAKRLWKMTFLFGAVLVLLLKIKNKHINNLKSEFSDFKVGSFPWILNRKWLVTSERNGLWDSKNLWVDFWPTASSTYFCATAWHCATDPMNLYLLPQSYYLGHIVLYTRIWFRKGTHSQLWVEIRLLMNGCGSH